MQQNKKNILKLTRTGKTLDCGCEKLRLFIDGNLELLDIPACSGQPYAQTFRKAGDDGNISGSMEPLPQGMYAVDAIEWASAKDDYNGSWGKGLGPIFVAVTCAQEHKRGAFGIHLDANRSTAPGTAGCVGILTLEDLKTLVKALRQVDPKALVVDWGL